MNDLERVTKQSYGMIAYAGMSEKLPNLCYYSNDEYQIEYSDFHVSLGNVPNQLYHALFFHDRDGHFRSRNSLCHSDILQIHHSGQYIPPSHGRSEQLLLLHLPESILVHALDVPRLRLEIQTLFSFICLSSSHNHDMAPTAYKPDE